MISIRMQGLMIFCLTFFSCYASSNDFDKGFAAGVNDFKDELRKLVAGSDAEARAKGLPVDGGEGVIPKQPLSLFAKDYFLACGRRKQCAIGVGVLLIAASLCHSTYRVCKDIKKRVAERNERKN